jgi:hypothetical protein
MGSIAAVSSLGVWGERIKRNLAVSGSLWLTRPLVDDTYFWDGIRNEVGI